MADIDIRRTHGMGHAAARAAAEKMADHLGKRFGLRGDWRGDTLAFSGTGVTGTLELDAKEVRLAVTLGFLLRAMRGSIEQAVHGELDRLFSEAEPVARRSEAKATPPSKGKPATTARKAAASRKKGA